MTDGPQRIAEQGVTWATRCYGIVTARVDREDAERWAAMGQDRGREAVAVVPVALLDSLTEPPDLPRRQSPEPDATKSGGQLIEKMNQSVTDLAVTMNVCPCCNGKLLPSDKSCDWCRAGACTSAPCTYSPASEVRDD